MPWPGGLQFVVQMALSPSAGGGVWDSAQWDVDSWGGSEPSWLTITDDVLSVTTTQGRQTFDERFATGVMSVVLNNVDGKYTPDFGAPPPGQLTLRPGRWMRLGVYQLQDPVSATDPVPAGTAWNDDTVRPWESFGNDVTVTRDVQVPAEIRVLFVGYIDTLDDAHFLGGSDTEMTVTCFDLASMFAMMNPAPLLSPVGAGETTGDRVTRILDAAGWLTGPEYRDVQPGAHTLQETTLSNNYLFEAQEAARSELGGFFFDGTVATFKQFGWLSTDPRSTTVQSFPGRGLTGDPLIVDADPFWSAQVIRNDYQLTRLGESVPVTSFSGISKQLYGERSYVYASYLNDNDPDLQAVADALLEAYQFDYQRLQSVSLTVTDDAAAALQVIDMRIGDLVQPTVDMVLPGWEYTVPTHVQGIAWTVGASDWVCTVRLDASQRTPPGDIEAFDDGFDGGFF